MATERKSFSELLGEAPLASSERTIKLTGALTRSIDPGKFVLNMGNNQSVTLDVDAVIEHRVLSGMIGQTIVQVEVDRDRVPDPVKAGPQVQADFRKPPLTDFTVTFLDHPMTLPWSGMHSDVFLDFPFKTPNESAGTIQEQINDPGNLGVDPAAGQGAMPFALATPHQVPQMPEALPAVPFHTGPWDLQTFFRYDKPVTQDTTLWFYPEQASADPTGQQFQAPPYRTSPYLDHTITYRDKPPIADITGHFPYPD